MRFTPDVIVPHVEIAIDVLGGWNLYQALEVFIHESAREDVTSLTLEELLSDEVIGTRGCENPVPVALLVLCMYGFGVWHDGTIMDGNRRAGPLGSPV